MKRRISLITVCMVFSVIMLSGCTKSNASDNKGEAGKNPTRTVTSTLVPTIAILPAKTSNKEEIEQKDKEQKSKELRAEAYQVIEDYFIAVKEHDKKDPHQYLAERLKHVDFSNVKDAELISASDKDGKLQSLAYRGGTGAETSPYKVLSFEVTYRIINKDDRKGSEPGGKFTQWFTLVKDKETSPWLIAEVGY